MREELSEVEHRLSSRFETSISSLHEELAAEKQARTALEERVARLEGNCNLQSHDAREDVDKSIVVIGGFGDKSMEEAETVAREVLHDERGLCDVTVTDTEPALALARFESPAVAMKFIRSQRKHPRLQAATLWAAENRSREDRRRLKVVSKLKKYLIELGSYSPKNVVASYKSYKVVLRENAKLVPIANINDDLSVNWLHDGVELQPVRVALEEFIGDME